MKAFSQAFADHIAGEATTLAWCWRIMRTDGVTLGFTDHDRAIAFGGVSFDPASGLEGSESVARLGGQTQTTEVLGILASEAVTEDDILLGRYDGARVESWRVNWRETSERALLRVDTIGEITREDGVFRAELRSGQHAMNVVKGRFYQHICDARLGDARCRVNLGEPGMTKAATVVSVAGDRVTVSGLSGVGDGWCDHGTARWTSGKRIGIADGIASQRGPVLAMARPVGDWVAVGDTLEVVAGCDRTFATCREKFGNGVNFQGFPHIPGNDALMRYPDAGDALDGRPRVR